MVFFSSRISPFTSTVIFRDRSPRATAVVTSAMFRTWAVRFDAMELTLSVRSFHVPATPGTCAWPPSRPSVPTSRATRVTSPANALSWSTMVLMVSFSSRISPDTFTVIFLDRSPCATAVATSAMLRTCPVRLEAIEFTLSVRSFQVPATPDTEGWTRHDLRRTGATMLGEMGELPDIIEAALNHVTIHSPLAATYNRSRYRPQVAAALQRLADALDGIEAGATKVVPL